MMKRIPEPELMDAPEQAQAYAQADFTEPNSLFVRLFEQTFAPASSGRLIDVGCGPADICIRLAKALPGWQITGIDAGPNMLTLGHQAIAAVGLTDRIELVECRLPQLPEPTEFDAVVSNSLLHHLPDPMTLWRSIRALAAPGAAVQVMDLERPESQQAAARLVDEGAADEPEVLRTDFYNSLLAAWRVDEVAEQLARAGLDQFTISRPSDRHWLVQGRI